MLTSASSPATEERMEYMALNTHVQTGHYVSTWTVKHDQIHGAVKNIHCGSTAKPILDQPQTTAVIVRTLDTAAFIHHGHYGNNRHRRATQEKYERLQ